MLIKLIEILSGQSLSVEYGLTRVHCIQNVQRVLEFLQYRKVRIVNIRPDEIVDGNPKLTLGLIWIIILHFQVSANPNPSRELPVQARHVTFASHAPNAKKEYTLSDLLYINCGTNTAMENLVPEHLGGIGSRVIYQDGGSGSMLSLGVLDETAGRNLLAWCRAVTAGYHGVDVRDFSTSWSDGRAFLAIIHRYK
ncbi:unnamed protein product [Mesocestoides corti]|uniref:Calponin-homology (CH) domain-containing protein n=1 Tax=Mesocestoides corti TaxID=53468 RepID=A0A3P6HLE6_MESCO|nr:unnamed protein product [Mesocestoides corti]